MNKNHLSFSFALFLSRYLSRADLMASSPSLRFSFTLTWGFSLLLLSWPSDTFTLEFLGAAWSSFGAAWSSFGAVWSSFGIVSLLSSLFFSSSSTSCFVPSSPTCWGFDSEVPASFENRFLYVIRIQILNQTSRKCAKFPSWFQDQEACDHWISHTWKSR